MDLLKIFRGAIYQKGFKFKPLALIMPLFYFLNTTAFATCLDISDEPVLTQAQAAPSIVMFVLDNSGSMDWEVMTSESGGLYSGKGYVYPDSAYINGHDRNTTWEPLTATHRQEWKSQWSGYNKVFYNPSASYSPWPNMSNADVDEPFSNPNNNSGSDSKFNMDGVFFTVTSDTTTEVIVDNDDTGFSLNDSNAWTNTSNAKTYQGDNYHFSSTAMSAADDWAQWTPELPVAGNYDVHISWTNNAGRDDSVSYLIHHSGGDSLPAAQDQTVNEGAWNLIDNYAFTADGTEYVRLIPDTFAQSAYSADAVRFTYTSGTGAITINVSNAHYFVSNDTNGDGDHDTGEPVYLVNFVDRDGDGTLDGRDYYFFDDAGTADLVENGELVYKDYSSVPDWAKASNYDEDNVFVSFKTDAEDLQNFANWFSFYRKRELTSKAAVSKAIYDLDYAYVGFYSINSGLRQAVLPIKVKVNGIIVDNKDPGYQESGSFSESGASNEYNGSSRYTRGSGNYAKWTPTLQADNYKVYVWYTKAGSRDTNAKYTVHHKGGDYTVRLNQQINDSQWVELGQFDFNAGTDGYVKVTRDSASTERSTSADAVKFVSTTGGGVEVDSTDTLLSSLYGMDSSGSTPLRIALKKVGQYLDADDGNTGGLGTSPFAAEIDGGSCQQAFAVVMTDGFWNGSTSPSVGNQDADSAMDHDGPPYADTYSNTLADVAMKYYKEDLVDTVPNEVPTTSCDVANHQHMVTYGVSFGVTGTLTPSDYDPCLLDGSKPPWPDPTAGNSQKIDDLYHAAINGRGLFFSASDPQELVSSLADLTSNIASRVASGSSVSVNGEELNSGTILFQASYISGEWSGNVKAFPVDPITGFIDLATPNWDASDKLGLTVWSDRKIVTYNPDTSTGVAFAYDNLATSQKTFLAPTETEGRQVADYIKGRPHTDFTGFRERKKLGDIVHSAPALVGDTIYVGANDGMLHAFDANNGTERFAYIPNLVYDNFYDETTPTQSFHKPGYSHKFFVDLTPASKKYVDIEGEATGERTLLVGGLGKGGKGYYCLDITNADTVSDVTGAADLVKWEYPGTTTDDDMGYSYSSPVIVKSYAPHADDPTKRKWVIIFGNGYNSTNGNAVLYILNTNGTLLRKIDTGVGGCNGLSSPSVVDVNADLRADYVYAGDLKGNLWKFDLTDPDPSNWSVAFEDSTPTVQPLISVPGKPITSKPDVMHHCKRGLQTGGPLLSCSGEDTVTGYMVMFGTGKFLHVDDRLTTDSQYVFGVWDYGDDADDTEYLGVFDETATGTDPQLSNLDYRIKLVEQTAIFNDYITGDFYRVLSNNSANWTVKCDGTTGQQADPDPVVIPTTFPPANAGWYFKLPNSGERVVKNMIIRGSRLIYLTFTPDSSPCSGGGNSILHEVDACSGARLDYATIDIDGDRTISTKDWITVGSVSYPPSGIGKPGMLHVPVILDIPDTGGSGGGSGGEGTEVKIFSKSDGSTLTVFEKDIPKGVFYWRSN